MEVTENNMERLQVNLIQDKTIFEQSFVETILKQYSTTPSSIPYKNPAYAYEKDYYLDFKEDRMLVLDQNEGIINQALYSQIKHVVVSMCSRWPGVRYNRYQVDLDIDLGGNVMKFEIFNPQHFIDVIHVFETHQIEMIDMAGIVTLFKTFPDYNKLGEYLGKGHFNELAKLHGLDHPRGD